MVTFVCQLTNSALFCCAINLFYEHLYVLVELAYSYQCATLFFFHLGSPHSLPALSLRLVTHRSEHCAAAQHPRSAEQFEHKKLYGVPEQGAGGEMRRCHLKCITKYKYQYITNINIITVQEITLHLSKFPKWSFCYFSGSHWAKGLLSPHLKCVTLGSPQFWTLLSPKTNSEGEIKV